MRFRPSLQSDDEEVEKGAGISPYKVCKNPAVSLLDANTLNPASKNCSLCGPLVGGLLCLLFPPGFWGCWPLQPNLTVLLTATGKHTRGWAAPWVSSADDTVCSHRHLQARATPAPQTAKAVLFFHGAPDLNQRETAPRALGRFSCSHLSANQVANETTCTDASDPLHGLLLAFL